MRSVNFSLRFWAFLCLLVCGCVGYGQSVKWSVAPTQYVDIEPIGNKLFKATESSGGSVIIDDAGRSIVSSSEWDRITPSYRGWALLLNGSQLVGCIKDDGAYCIFKQKGYRTIKKQEFVSEGLITATRSDGVKVYIDTAGNEKFGADKDYYHIMPFSDGYAVVFKGPKQSCHIDKYGQEVNPEVKAGVRLTHATNFYKGVAYVWDDNGNCFEFDGKRCKETRMPDGKPDYLFRLSDEGGSIPYDVSAPGKITPDVSVSEAAGKYGFDAKGKTLLPCQFVNASPFVNQLAVVRTANGKSGILRYCPDSKGEFEINNDSFAGPIQYEKSQSPITCMFAISSVPSEWQSEKLAIRLDGEDNRVTDQGDGCYSFNFKPYQGCDGDFLIGLYSQELLLYEKTIHYEFVLKAKEAVAPSPVREETTKEPQPLGVEDKTNPKHSKNRGTDNKKVENVKKKQDKKEEKSPKNEEKVIKQRKRR